MFGFSPKLPVSEEDRRWVDEGFRRLEKLLGRQRMLDAKVVLPTAEISLTPTTKLEMLLKTSSSGSVLTCG